MDLCLRDQSEALSELRICPPEIVHAHAARLAEFVQLPKQSDSTE